MSPPEACTVSATRLKLRHGWLFPVFLYENEKVVRQLRCSAGFLSGMLLIDRHYVLWTLTAWKNAAAMKAFRSGGAHLAVMPKLGKWCSEAHTATWDAPDSASLPAWPEVYLRILAGTSVLPLAPGQAPIPLAMPRVHRRLQRRVAPDSSRSLMEG